MDVTTNENLDKLVKIGERLLKKPVSRVNLETGLSMPVENGGTNEEALKRYTQKLIRLNMRLIGQFCYIQKICDNNWCICSLQVCKAPVR